jgi:hypothetical protein
MDFIYQIAHAIKWLISLIDFFLLTGCIWLIDNYRIFLEPWQFGVLFFGPFFAWEALWWYRHRIPPEIAERRSLKKSR